MSLPACLLSNNKPWVISNMKFLLTKKLYEKALMSYDKEELKKTLYELY